MCTDIDIAFMKGQLMAIDVGVRSFFVTTNAVTDVDLLTFLEEVAADFGPDRFYYIRNEQNAGVAPIWNAILHHRFERNNYSWVMIGNADLHPHKGQLAPWLEWVYSGGNVEACAVLYYTLHWAAFGLTRTGFEKLGMFDENLWPAWNQKDVAYSTWVLDPNLRSCIETGHGVKIRGLCAYNLVGLAPLILQNNRPAVWVDQRLSKTPRFEGRKNLSAPM
ncbi:hypothetical protein DIPPA_29088 [Diplonema papillatum]|nr:hypothetical protein DIPPA_29088 [Diplonema papillatum]